MPQLNKKYGTQGYFYIYPNEIWVTMLTADEKSGLAVAKEAWTPILEKLGSFPGVAKPIYQYNQYPSFSKWFDDAFGALDPYDPSSPPELEAVTPHGITHMDSRLLGSSHLSDPKLSSALREAMPNMESGMLRGHLVGGDKVLEMGNDTSVHPSWRKTYIHLIATGNGGPNAMPLKKLAPDMGCYSNEVSLNTLLKILPNALLTLFSVCTLRRIGKRPCMEIIISGSMTSRRNTTAQVQFPIPPIRQ
jgi:hypothetical protein